MYFEQRTLQVLILKSCVYLVKTKIPSNHCQVPAQYFKTAITPRT